MHCSIRTGQALSYWPSWLNLHPATEAGRAMLPSSLGLEHLPWRHRRESSWGPGKAHMMALLHKALLQTESASQWLSEIGWMARRIRVPIPIHTPASSGSWTDKSKGQFWFTFLLWSSCANLGPMKGLSPLVLFFGADVRLPSGSVVPGPHSLRLGFHLSGVKLRQIWWYFF